MKKILAFEADASLADQLTRQFEAYGCAVDVVDDGNVGLQKARSDQPDLILLTIELPKMNGFSICNKLKKNPELKSIPLIILSSEATEDTFQQHRKLRTHAEDYLRKPFDFGELLTKVQGLIDLGSAGREQPTPSESEIAIDADALELVLEEDEAPAEEFSAVDDDVEAFAEEAFAALQVEKPPAVTYATYDGDERTIAGESPFQMGDDRGHEAPPAHSASELEPVAAGGPSADETRLLAENESLAAARASLEREVEGLRREVESARAAHAAGVSGAEGQVADLRAKVAAAEETARSLRRDKEILEQQVSQLKEQVQKVGEGGGVSSREFLDLRELLNRKDRELLDLKDSINSKEKALLDQRERMTAADRQIADRDDKILGLERANADLSEKLKATTDDKDMLARKVEGLEKRVDAAHADLERLRKELASEQDAHKESRRAAEERRERDLAQLRESLESAAADAQEAALSSLRDELSSKHGAEVEALRRDQEQALREAEQRREQELTEQRLRHEAQLKATEEDLRSQAERRVAELEAAHHASTEAAARAHADELRGLRSDHAAEVAGLKEQHAEAIDDLKESQQREMGVLGSKLARTESRLEETEEERKAGEARCTDLKAQLSDRDTTISNLRVERDGLEGELGNARSVIAAREGEIVSLKARIDEVERWNGHNEERALRALRKVKGDGEVIDRAKRALAIALTLLADMPELEDVGPPNRSTEGTLRT